MSNPPQKPPKRSKQSDQPQQSEAEQQPTSEPEEDMAAVHEAARADEQEHKERVRAKGSELRHAVIRISEQCPSHVRAIVDRYYGCIARSQAEQGEATLPRAVRRHKRDHNRSYQPGWGNLLCFHIGNAILDYYYLVRTGEADELRLTLKHLQEIAAHGPGQYVEYGDDARGYMLLHIDSYRKLAAEQQRRENDGADDA